LKNSDLYETVSHSALTLLPGNRKGIWLVKDSCTTNPKVHLCKIADSKLDLLNEQYALP